VVPEVGIEPTHLSVPDFESGASTSSTTRARAGFYKQIAGFRQAKSLASLEYQALGFLGLPPFAPLALAAFDLAGDFACPACFAMSLRLPNT
jgi:hypothetical protein